MAAAPAAPRATALARSSIGIAVPAGAPPVGAPAPGRLERVGRLRQRRNLGGLVVHPELVGDEGVLLGLVRDGAPGAAEWSVKQLQQLRDSGACSYLMALRARRGGSGGFGGLGHGDRQDKLLPMKVEAFAGQRVVAVSAGDDYSLALTADGAIWSWGFGDFGLGQLGHGDNQNQLLHMKAEAFAWQRVVAVSAGDRHSLAITADGALWSWGGGAFGCLGHGNEQSQLLPKKVEALAGRRVVALSAELDADGAVFTWGAGGLGRLGHGEDLSNQLLPKKVEAPSRE